MCLSACLSEAPLSRTWPAATNLSLPDENALGPILWWSHYRSICSLFCKSSHSGAGGPPWHCCQVLEAALCPCRVRIRCVLGRLHFPGLAKSLGLWTSALPWIKMSQQSLGWVIRKACHKGSLCHVQGRGTFLLDKEKREDAKTPMDLQTESWELWPRAGAPKDQPEPGAEQGCAEMASVKLETC